MNSHSEWQIQGPFQNATMPITILSADGFIVHAYLMNSLPHKLQYNCSMLFQHNVTNSSHFSLQVPQAVGVSRHHPFHPGNPGQSSPRGVFLERTASLLPLPLLEGSSTSVRKTSMQIQAAIIYRVSIFYPTLRRNRSIHCISSSQ